MTEIDLVDQIGSSLLKSQHLDSHAQPNLVASYTGNRLGVKTHSEDRSYSSAQKISGIRYVDRQVTAQLRD